MDDDPITTFFPDEESVDLYAVLNLTSSATFDEIKKSYRRLALLYHPDKQRATSSTEQDHTSSSTSQKFQQVGFAYAVLSDTKRREKYDLTGRTDEGLDLDKGEDGWDAYFEAMFEEVTRGKLDEMKKEYQGSQEEIDDLKAVYVQCSGSIEEIMTHIPHSTHEDEARFVITLSSFVSSGELPHFDNWDKSVKDEKARLSRKKKGEKEAVEAEKLAKELGVWDEFYGSGKKGARKGKGKGKEKDDEEDTSALQALILSKRKKASGFLDDLAAKYMAMEDKPSKKKRGREEEGDKEPKKKKTKVPPPPDIDDEEFAKLQDKLFNKPAAAKATKSKTSKHK